VGPKSTEIAKEQEFFDLAEKHRERLRSAAEETPEAAAHPAAAKALRRDAQRRRESVGPPDEAVAIGRIDSESGEIHYIGKHLITDEAHEPLVISWKSPAAEPFYRASQADRMRLVRKRTFECTGNRIDDFAEVIYASLESGQAGPDADLLRELGRGRTGRLKEIVQTIQDAQFELIRAPLDQILVIEGGPGTGKTAIALHRVSWLLYHHRDRLRAEDILVVGPHPTFTRYISSVLPSLGEEDVSQMDIAQLAPQVRRGRREVEQVSRLKGDLRMANLLARAIEARIGGPEPVERLQVDGRFITLPGVEIADAVAISQQAAGPYGQRRQVLRDRLVQLLANRGITTTAGAMENLLGRLWPQLTAAAFLRDLFGSRERLLAAAGDEFSIPEIQLLRRRASDRLSEEVWTRDDLPLLDEAEYLINGAPRRYAHIVVDEVQDLSPMQLRSIARRSLTGSLTVVGDLAQSTGAWARDTWPEVLAHLPNALPHTVAHLRYGYRVPREVFDFTAPLLQVAAPDTIAPEVIRQGPASPGVHRVQPAERAGRVAGLALAHAAEQRFVGIVCPPSLRAEVEEALAANGSEWSSADRGELGRAINLVSPQETKGLEFDAVIVVEPEEIVAIDPRGHRLLYVALTRTTGYLDIVCAGQALPMVAPIMTPSEVDHAEPQQTVNEFTGLARQIEVMIRANVPQPRWAEVLRQAARRLGQD
jgi:DNA helicase IV